MAAKNRKSKAELGKYVCSRWATLKAERAPFDAVWDDLARYILPLKDEVNGKSTPSTAPSALLFDATAIRANQTYSNGVMSYTTPMDSPWFAFSPPTNKRDSDKCKAWLQTCSEIAQEELVKSNFYVEAHESYHDDGAFSTTCMTCVEGRESPFVFRNLAVATYAMAENAEGNVDTLYLKFEWDVRQIAEEFGEEAMSEKLRKELEEFRKTGKGGTAKHTILHAIYPRSSEERDPGKIDEVNKAFASVHVEEASKNVLRVSGFDEKPFFACRHRKQSGHTYGYGPGWVALPDARQLNILVKNLDVLAEVKANPRLLIPNDMEGEVDMTAGGMTFFDPNKAQLGQPREWLTAGDYNIGMDREKIKKEAIEQAFYVDLFQMFASLDKPMTAREVAERAGEKLVQFTPAFARKTTEFLTPLLRRVFGILYRGGFFPTPPDEMWETDPQGQKWIPLPNIGYTSKIALAIKAQANIAFFRTMELLNPLFALKPELLDNYNFDQVARDAARNEGFPSDWAYDEEKVEEIREARAQAQAALEQQQQLLTTSQAASNVGKIPAESPVAQAIGRQLGS